MKIRFHAIGIASLLVCALWAGVTEAQARRLNFMDGVGYQARLKESRDAYAKAWAAQQQRLQPKASTSPKRKNKSSVSR
jgi:hypothetical protein